MKISFVTIVAGLLFITLGFGQSEKSMYKQLLRPKNAAYYHVPVGLCEDYPEESTNLDIIRGDMELMKRSGTKVLRIAFGWDGIQNEKEKYNWLFWDDYVKMAVDEYGVTLIPYICYTPRWNSTGDTSNYWNHTPKDYDAFGTFVEVIVGRYKPWIKSWELWNEPDINAYWSGNAEDLARLTKIGAQAVKRADPEAMVVLAGLAGHTTFTKYLFRDYGISPFVDVVNCHNYFETWNPLPIENIPQYVNELSEIIQRYGNGQALWMAEVGYSSFRKPDGYVSNEYSCTYAYEHTPEYQAIAMLKMLTLDLSTDKLSAIAWYRIKDLKVDEAVIGDVNNRHLGVALLDHTPKPAEKTITFAHKLFDQPSRCIDKEVQIQRMIGSESEIHCFENQDGSLIVIGWLKTKIPGKIFDQSPGNLQDNRKETISLAFPRAVRGKSTAYNEQGDSKPFTGMSTKGKSTRIDKLVLEGGKMSIIKIGK